MYFGYAERPSVRALFIGSIGCLFSKQVSLDAVYLFT